VTSLEQAKISSKCVAEYSRSNGTIAGKTC
jgi:hypothetical protein